MNPNDLLTFQNAIALARADQKDAAYHQLKALAQTYPADVNVLLWIVFTTPYMIEAETVLAHATALDPDNTNVQAARTWLEAERRKRREQQVAPHVIVIDSPQVIELPPENTPIGDIGQINLDPPPPSYAAQAYPPPPIYSSTSRPRRRGIPIVAVLLGTILLLALFSIGYLVASGELTTRRATMPQNGAFTGDVALLDRIEKASSDFTSVKMTIDGSAVMSDIEVMGVSYNDKVTMTFIKPDLMSFSFGTGDKMLEFVAIGDYFYLKQNGGAWQRQLGRNGRAIVSEMWQKMSTEIFGVIHKLGGSSVAFKKDQQFEGRDVGVIEIDTASATNPAAKKLKNAKITILYDKKTNRILRFSLVSGLFDMGNEDTRFIWDSPDTHVYAPI